MPALTRLLDPEPRPITTPVFLPPAVYLLGYGLCEGLRLNLLHAFGRGR